MGSGHYQACALGLISISPALVRDYIRNSGRDLATGLQARTRRGAGKFASGLELSESSRVPHHTERAPTRWLTGSLTRSQPWSCHGDKSQSGLLWSGVLHGGVRGRLGKSLYSLLFRFPFLSVLYLVVFLLLQLRHVARSGAREYLIDLRSEPWYAIIPPTLVANSIIESINQFALLYITSILITKDNIGVQCFAS